MLAVTGVKWEWGRRCNGWGGCVKVGLEEGGSRVEDMGVVLLGGRPGGVGEGE